MVEALDKVEDLAAGFSWGTEAVALEQVAPRRSKKAFTQGIVEAILNRSHGRPDTSSATTLGKGNRGVLSALVRMMDHAVWTSLPQSHLQRIEHQLSPEVSLHGPSSPDDFVVAVEDLRIVWARH